MIGLPPGLSKLIPSAAHLSPQEVLEVRASSLRRLTTLLRLVEGAWALAVYESGDIQRALMRELSQGIQPLPLIEVSLLKQKPDPLALLRGLARDHEAPIIVFYDLSAQLDDLAGSELNPPNWSKWDEQNEVPFIFCQPNKPPSVTILANENGNYCSSTQ